MVPTRARPWNPPPLLEMTVITRIATAKANLRE